LQQKLNAQFDETKSLLAELLNLVKLEDQATQKGIDPVEEFMMVNYKGDLQRIDTDYLKLSAATTLADGMHDSNLTLKQLFFLGLDDDETTINLGTCSAADVLQFALEKKLMLKSKEKDMVVMLHEIVYRKSGATYKATSSFVLKGEDAKHTAMAKTVGLPLGIATRLILNGTLKATGIHIPISTEIYEPVLAELELYGIHFIEKTVVVEKNTF
jgi:saccharopine dehydrogenase-like NADP-dependent oxidoreductase